MWGIPGLIYSGIAGGIKKGTDAIDEGPVPQVSGFDPSKHLSKDNKLSGQNYYDDRITEGLLPAQQARGGKFFADTLNYGLDPNSAGPLTVPGLPGDTNDPMVAAINEKSAADSARAVRGLTTRQAEGADVAASDQQGQVARQASAVYQNEVSNFMQQYEYQMKRYQLKQQYEQAKAQAKAQLYGSIFGGIARIAGTAAGAA